MVSAFDPVIYDAQGRSFTCQEAIAMRGGWGNVSAEEAAQLAEFGCFPPFDSEYAAPTAPVDEEQIPLWTGPVEDMPAAISPVVENGILETGGVVASPPVSQQPVVYTAPSPVGVIEEEPMDYFSVNDIWTTPSLSDELGSWLANGLQDMTQFPSAPEVINAIDQRITQQRVQVTPGAACWQKAGKLSKRARVKIIRNPDGTSSVLRYCAPRRMNPCNARALGRAARRLGMFQRMSSGIEKIINRQLKRKSSGRRPYFAGCAPKRKGCR